LGYAVQHFEHALQLKPTNIYIAGSAAFLTGSLDRLDETTALNEYVVACGPVNPIKFKVTLPE
jgi:hypothetical protein